MVLNGQEVKSRGYVKNADDRGFRNSSYDLRIGMMMSAKEEGDLDKFVLEPQGVVEVISAERIELPANIVGYAMVKTTLCNEGIFAINIGIVDPLYSGLLSSTLVNFGKKPYPLVKDQVFLRLSFHEFKPQETSKGTPMQDPEYLADKRAKVKNRFSATFLDIDATAARVSKTVFEELFNKWKTTLLWFLPVAALLFGLISFLVNWGATWSGRNTLMDTYLVRESKLAETRQADKEANDRRMAALEQQLKEMTAQLQALRNSGAGRGSDPGSGSTGRR